MQSMVTYQCGHSERATLYGGHYDDQIARLRQRLCPACYRAERLAQDEALLTDMPLPALTGTDKQVAWARQIRAEVLLVLIAYADNPRYVPEHDTILAATRRLADAQTTARWWIDHMSDLPRDLVRPYWDSAPTV